jgi:hypothetical protein
MATRYNYTGGIVTDGLVLNLDAAKVDSYPGTGTTWYDISGNNNNGTLTNGPTFSGIGKQASIVFDGADDYVIRTDASLKNYTTITANIWMNVNSTGSWETYFSYNAEEAGLTQGWGVRRQSNLNNYQYWGGTGNSGIKLYKNGTLISSGSASSVVADGFNTTGSWNMITVVATGVSSWSTHNRLTIATRSDLGGGSVNMRASSFTLYSKELSANEITQNFNALRGRYGI